MNKKNLLAIACIATLFASAVTAQPATYRAPGMGNAPAMNMPQRQKPASDVEQAAAVLRAGLDKLMGFFQAGTPPNQAKISEFLDKQIAPYFDFTYMTRWAAGKIYPRMNPQQRAALEAELRTQFLTTMAQKLSRFNKQTVRYLAPKVGQRGQVELSIAIGNPGGYPARLDFRMYKSPQGWKVYDVSANGSSALVYYRNYFKQKMKMQRYQRQMPPAGYRR